MRILLLCERVLSRFDLSVLDEMSRYPQLKIVGAVINARQKPTAIQRVKRELRKGRGGYVIVQIVGKLIKKRDEKASLAVEYCKENSIPNISITSLYEEEAVAWLRAKEADVILLRGFGIIREPLLSLTPYGVLSYHHGDLRKYRGGPPAFWELYNDEKEMGVTMQILDEGLDTGTIVLQRSIAIRKSDSWKTLRERAYEASTSMAAEALLTLASTGPMRAPEGTKGRFYTLPNLRQWLYLQLKIILRRLSL
jgi:methionyl-tRNA formyltransferase